MLLSEPIVTEHKDEATVFTSTKKAKVWIPKRVVFTAEAIDESYGQQIHQRITRLGIEAEILKNNRLTGLRGETERETYKIAKNTLAIVKAPPSAFRLTPIPPSADWQFHLAQGCPAHCQYCYLAGSLSGPPAIRVYANLPEILSNLKQYEKPGFFTTFEASCYTDPLGIEHLTGGLEETIKYFGNRPDTQLRIVSKFDAIDPLLSLQHNNHTRFRISLNAEQISKRLEGGTATVDARMKALHKLALPKEQGGGGYPVGVVLAPIMPIPDWQEHYTIMLQQLQQHLDFSCDLTFELITHRFTPGSKDVLMEWYPNTGLDMSEDNRTIKRNKFGGMKYVYTKDIMKALKTFFEKEIRQRFRFAKILYWT
jgi:spore photoproduct lyase